MYTKTATSLHTAEPGVHPGDYGATNLIMNEPWSGPTPVDEVLHSLPGSPSEGAGLLAQTMASIKGLSSLPVVL